MIIEIIDFFTCDVMNDSFYLKENQQQSFNRINHIRYLVHLLFDKGTSEIIEYELKMLVNYVVYRVLPEFDEVVEELLHYDKRLTKEVLNDLAKQFKGDKEKATLELFRIVIMFRFEPMLEKYRVKL